jgi:CelD/BcsL family acetyltransferase involved in cellulose biosynthesis
MVTTDVITHLDDLEKIAGVWDDVTGDAGWSSVFASHAFALHWYRCFAAPDAVRVYPIVSGGTTVGFLPLVFESTSGRRVLRSLTNLHCLHSTPAIRRGLEGEFSRALTTAVAASSDWDLLQYDCSYSFLPAPRPFDREAATAAGLHIRESHEATFSVALPATFDEYCSKHLTPNAKKNHHRMRNRLARAGQSAVRAFHGRDALPEFDAFVAIENAGWKGDRGTSIEKLDGSYRAFYDGLLDLLAARSELSIYFLELNGGRIAGVLGYVEGDVFHWFKTGYDEAYGEFAPSNLLLVGIIEDLVRHRPGIRRFHMFPTDFGYKHRYANETPLCISTVVYNRTVRGRLSRVGADARLAASQVPGARAVVDAVRRAC